MTSREAAADSLFIISAAASRLIHTKIGCDLGLTPKATCCRRFATRKCATSKSVTEGLFLGDFATSQSLADAAGYFFNGLLSV